MGVGLFYGAFIIVGGLLALLLSTIAVAAATSLGGSYAVFWGEDLIVLYCVHNRIIVIVGYMIHYLQILCSHYSILSHKNLSMNTLFLIIGNI